MKKLTIVLTLITISGYVFAQQDSIIMKEKLKAAYLDKFAWKNPLLRQAGISTDVYAAGNIKSDLYGNSFFKGKYKAVRTNAYFNAPVLHFGKNRLTAGLAVSHQTIHLTNIVNLDPSFKFGDRVEHNTLLRPSLNFTRTDRLFNIPVIYSATGSVLIEPNSGETKFSGTGMVLFTLKHNEKTTFSVGAIGIIDPSALFPVFPAISYSHQFNRNFLFTLDPSGIALRKEFNSRNALTISNTLGSNLSLFKRDIINLPVEQAYTTFEMKSGLTYEHLFGRKIVASFSAGASSMLTSKVLDGKSNTFIKSTQSTVPYVRLGVSFLPFWKGLEK